MSRTAFSIYNASAGSGKTHTLVKEYLKILMLDKSYDGYRKILAITFTNKAVNEMKSRIVSALYAFSLPEIDKKNAQMLQQIAVESGLEEIVIREKSKIIIKNIIHNYAAFDISTIDKFTHKVIRSFAHDLDLPMSFDVSLDTEALLQEAVDSIIAKAGTDETLTKLLIDFSLDKTDNDKSWDVSRELMEIGRLLLNENNRTELELFHQATIPDFIEIRKKLQAEIKDLNELAKALANEIFDIINTNGIEIKSFSGQYFPKHIQSILDDKFSNSSKKYIETEDIKINKTAKEKEVIESLIPDFIQRTNKIYEAFGKKSFYEAFLKNLTPLSLLNSISLEIERIQSEQNILSISQFNAIINNEIQNQPAPFIYERLGEKYRHFFIDEFQDTSEMQWNNLIPLIDNALSGEDASGAQGSLMIVGDPKQSIYRWRGGKAEQFISLSKEENPFSNPDKATKFLETNYRSYEQVITFNNDFFKHVANQFEHPDYKYLYENESSQNINSKLGGFVEIQFLEELDKSENEEETKTDLYLKATLKTIEDALTQGFEYQDIAVLTRKRKDGVLLANFLTENNIPILSSETLLINNATEVKLILNVLKYIKNNRDDEAKAQMLYFIARNKQSVLPVHDFISEGMKHRNEVDFQKWLNDFGIPMDFAFARKNSLYVTTEYIIDHFIKEKKTLSYVQYFMDLVLERTVRLQSSISDFITYWEDNYEKLSIPSPENTNAVKMMTIHKSKGLEFPVVIFPFAEEDYSRSRDKIWVEIEGFDELNIPKALIDLNKNVREYGVKAQEIFDIKKQEDLLDNINVLYVALTRAEEQLYIISNKKISSKGELANNMSSLFVSFLQNLNLFSEEENVYPFGKKVRTSEKKILSPEEIEATSPKLITAVEHGIDKENTIKIAQREALMWDTSIQKSIEYGNLVHEILSKIQYKKDIEEAISKAIFEGLLVLDQEDKVRSSIEMICNHEELQDFFRDDFKVFNEQNILKKGMPNIKPDRVVIKGNEAYILDYKTGAEHKKHIEQVKQYELALIEMGLNVTKKALVYTQEDDLKIIHLQ